MISMQGLVPGRILERYKRFLADVELADGGIATAHCTNTGAMKTCWEPGDLVLLAPSDNPARKLKYTWIACRRGGTWIGVDTGIPNKVVAEAARLDRLPGLAGLRDVRTEVRYGAESSRVDVLARDGEGRLVYLEVKNTTLRVGDAACFPDAVTARGAKHLRELQGMVREGHRAALVSSPRTPGHGAGGPPGRPCLFHQPGRCPDLRRGPRDRSRLRRGAGPGGRLRRAPASGPGPA